MSSCEHVCPDLEVVCGSRPHGPGVAHHASGTSADGTRWSLFWWHQDAAGDGVGLTGGLAAPPEPGGFGAAGAG
jgi:hypothetical protein